MVQGKITEADTPTIQLGATPSRLISDPAPSSPQFYAGCPSCCNRPTLSWLRMAPGMLDCMHSGVIPVFIPFLYLFQNKTFKDMVEVSTGEMPFL